MSELQDIQDIDFDSVEWTETGKSGSDMWNYKEQGAGALLRGVFMLLETNVGDNNSNIYNVETKDGMKAFWGSSLLDDRFKDLEPGDLLHIKYLGMKKSKAGGREYHDFETKISKRTPEKLVVSKTPF